MALDFRGATQGVRRPFAKQLPVRAGEAPELEETVLGRNERDGAARTLRHLQRLARVLQSVAEQVLLRTEAVNVMERVAERALADTSRAAQIGDQRASAGVLGHCCQRPPDHLRMRDA